MATTLKAVLQFTAVPAGGTATLAHGLNVSGTAVVPDAVALDNPAFDYVSSTTTTVTVVNNDTAAGSCDVLCERWHTVERAFGDGAATLPVVPTGLNEWIGVIIDNSNSFGGGNIESAYQFYLANALVDGSSSEGVQALFGVSRVQNATIQNSTRSGVLVSNTTTCTLDNVQGTGNTRYGVEGTYGAMVKRVNASAITGALGDTKPGAVAATAWGATPVTDPDQLVRIGT